MKNFFSILVLSLLYMTYANEINVNIYGLSYHFKKSEAYHNAPRSVFGSNGQWVYNPGIGVEYDFRKKGSMGFSGIVGMGYFRDCADLPFYFINLGIKYRNYFWRTNHWFWEAEIGGAYAIAHDWDVYQGHAIDFGTTTTAFPIALIGVGYQFKNGNNIKYQVTYVPEDNNIGGTSGTDLLFMWISYGF